MSCFFVEAIDRARSVDSGHFCEAVVERTSPGDPFEDVSGRVSEAPGPDLVCTVKLCCSAFRTESVHAWPVLLAAGSPDNSGVFAF